MCKLTKADYQEIYEILHKATPLSEDCGILCGAICCKQDNENLGMYLLPGEESMFLGDEDWLVWEEQSPEDYDFPHSWKQTVYFIRCTKECPREKRPIQCRTFPLAPYITKKGELILIRETLPLPYQCPLITNQVTLEKNFIHAVFEAWSKLIQDSRIYDLVEYDSQERQGLDIVYPPLVEQVLT
jgi:Fe-S-cluster containining protein